MTGIRKLPIVEVDKALKDKLISSIKVALEQAKKAEITGFSVMILNRNGTFVTESYFDKKLELMGALTAALQHIYYIDDEL